MPGPTESSATLAAEPLLLLQTSIDGLIYHLGSFLSFPQLIRLAHELTQLGMRSRQCLAWTLHAPHEISNCHLRIETHVLRSSI
jgi:hypothetical protein